MKANPIKVASWLIIIIAVVWILVIGKGLIIPFIVAVVFWFLINALQEMFGRIKVGKRSINRRLQYALSGLTVAGIAFGISQLVIVNVNALTEVLPTYQENLTAIVDPLMEQFGIRQVPDVSNYLSKINFSDIIGNLINDLSTLIGDAFLILIYVIFLLLEQSNFSKKLDKFFEESGQTDFADNTMDKVRQSIMDYLSIKTVVSLLTGVFSYIVLAFMGIDFAIFWAFLIFLLNFIPTIGSLIATTLPAAISLVQFPNNFTPFLVILLGVGSIQMLVGNYIEPKMMGDKLNVSPLVVLLSLSIWGAIWGVIGMFLCVPITVITIIVCAQFPKTRFIAILLSSNGKV